MEYPIETPVNVLSLGAGVQSSAMLMMFEGDSFKPRPDFCVFADTMAEPKAVYEWLQFLKSVTTIPIITCSYGDIVADHLNEDGDRFASAPFFVKNEDESQGMGRRQCTREYKLDPIYKAVRIELGYEPKVRVKHQVNMYIGISSDEVTRMKPSRRRWVKNKYPLIDAWISRSQCSEYVEKVLGRIPPRSACYMCPYRSNREWRHLRSTDPEAWDKAVLFDKKIRTLPKFDNENFVHRDMVPLDQVDLEPDRDQLDMFENDCEGMCGV